MEISDESSSGNNVNVLQGGLEDDLLFHHTGLIGVESKSPRPRTAPEAGSRLPNHRSR
jgi:hypothetical protein